MKKIRYGLIFICLFLILNSASFSQNEWDDNAVSQITNKNSDLFLWLKHGALFVRKLERDKSAEYLYCGSDGHLIAVVNPEKFSAMICEQLSDKQSAGNFVRNYLPRVFFAFMGPVLSSVIDKEELKYLNAQPTSKWESLTKDEKSGNYQWKHYADNEIQSTLQTIGKYDYLGPKIEDNRWTTDFYAVLHSGSIEKWHLDGDLYPFTIEHFNKTLSEKEGVVPSDSIKPINEATIERMPGSICEFCVSRRRKRRKN